MHKNFANILVANLPGRSPRFGLAIWDMHSDRSSFFPFLYIHFICTETKHLNLFYYLIIAFVLTFLLLPCYFLFQRRVNQFLIF